MSNEPSALFRVGGPALVNGLVWASDGAKYYLMAPHEDAVYELWRFTAAGVRERLVLPTPPGCTGVVDADVLRLASPGRLSVALSCASVDGSVVVMMSPDDPASATFVSLPSPGNVVDGIIWPTVQAGGLVGRGDNCWSLVAIADRGVARSPARVGAVGVDGFEGFGQGENRCEVSYPRVSAPTLDHDGTRCVVIATGPDTFGVGVYDPVTGEVTGFGPTFHDRAEIDGALGGLVVSDAEGLWYVDRGTNRSCLVSTGFLLLPAVSPDGRSVAVVRLTDGGSGVEIHRLPISASPSALGTPRT